MQLQMLPSGTSVYASSSAELRVLYEEIFRKHCYVRHGIDLQPGACVFDVGANIGVATLFFWLLQPTISIFCFEPIAEIYEILQANIALHGIPAHAFNVGLSNRRSKARFTYYPHNTVMSSMNADPTEDECMLNTLLENHGLSSDLLRPLVRSKLVRRDVICELTTLSHVIRSEAVQCIDLLKIDVEKSEWEVLLGLEEHDWPKVRRVVMEIHDRDGDREKICAALRSRGFHTVAEQDACRRNTRVYTVYGLRQS